MRGECICGKHQYRSKATARHMAARVRREHGERVEAYHCPFDRRFWHIGHPGIDRLPTRALLRDAVRRRVKRTTP